MGPAAQRFGEWASASRTFSAITDLIAVVQREFDTCSFFSPCMHAAPPACLPAEIVVDCSYVLAVKASPPDVEMARLVPLQYGGESALVPGCLCDGTGTLYRLFSDMTITPLQFACSGKAPVLRVVYLSMSIALGKSSRKRFL